MKERLISAAIGLSLMVMILFFVNHIIFNFAMALIIGLAVYELLSANPQLKDKALRLTCIVFSVLVPFFHIDEIYPYVPAIFFVYVLVLLGVFLLRRETVKIEQVAYGFFCTVLIPLGLGCILFLRDYNPSISLIYIVLVFSSAWLADAGGLFAGKLFGKHKFAPAISPKKTVEGVIGAVVLGTGGSLLVTFLCVEVLPFFDFPIQINYWALTGVVFLASCISIFGDLSASLIKRQFDLKDFGHILPGHGGIMDRFDSILLVAPLFLFMLEYFPWFITTL